jgi:hypothetical protein
MGPRRICGRWVSGEVRVVDCVARPRMSASREVGKNVVVSSSCAAASAVSSLGSSFQSAARRCSSSLRRAVAGVTVWSCRCQRRDDPRRCDDDAVSAPLALAAVVDSGARQVDGGDRQGRGDRRLCLPFRGLLNWLIGHSRLAPQRRGGCVSRRRLRMRADRQASVGGGAIGSDRELARTGPLVGANGRSA